MGKKQYQLEARKEHPSPELTIIDVIHSIEEAVKGIEKIVFENDRIDSSE
jgi:hypothetical protein